MPPTTNTKRPYTTTTKYTTQQRPSSTTPVQLPTIASPSQISESTTKFNYLSSPAPFKKTTYAPTTAKAPNQKPPSTTKRPYISTKKPYVSDSPYAKIPLSNTTRTETSTKTTTTTRRPVTYQERNPSTKSPEVKKPVQDKTKPSGIPSITHYLPISSSNPSPTNSTKTTSIHQNITSTTPMTITTKQKITNITKEPSRVTTTRRPGTNPASTQSTAQKHVQGTTKKPVKTNQSKPSSASSQKTSTNKVSQKTAKPTSTPQLVTKSQTKLTSVAHTTLASATKGKPASTSGTSRPVTNAPSVVGSTTKQSITSQKFVQTKKPESVKPSTNLIGQSSNIVNSKKKPVASVQSTNTVTHTPATNKYSPTTVMTTTSPEKITTFSYTSKVSPSGEVITSTVPASTTEQKFTTGFSSSAIPSSTVRNDFTPEKTTEKPLQKVTVAQQQLFSKYQTTKGQSTTGSFHKPTTYHPQNFPSNTRNPVTQSAYPNTSSVAIKTTPTTQSQKISSTTENISTTTLGSTKFPTQTSTDSVFTTQTVTKPATDLTTEGTTPTMTTIGFSSDSSHGETSTFSSDELPLQEIPLKLYESLKDNVGGAQDIMTTIMSENMPTTTTTGKFEGTFSTFNSDDATTLGSTMPVVDKMTTLMELLSSSSVTTPSLSNILMRNTSEYQNLNNNSQTQITEQKHNSVEESLLGSESMQAQLALNATKVSNTSSPSEDTTLSTTDTTNQQSTTSPESTTTVDSTTIYKDQILQDGISAVTSILLDEAQRQQAMKEAMLASVMKEKDNERLKTTTENESFSTTNIDYTEIQTIRKDSAKDEMKSEVRLNEETVLPEKDKTTEIPDTTTMNERQTTTMNTTALDSLNENINKSMEKKNEHKPLSIFPTKESKLNPDSDHVDEMTKVSFTKKQDHTIHPHTEPSLKLRTTIAPEQSSERVKIVDFEKSVPKPMNSFLKKPNPVYQPLESLQPPAAIELHPAPYESMGLEASTAFLGEDVRRFADLCNELAFRMWTALTGKGQISSRSLVMSPFAVTSLLAMVFLGARGPTSGQMNDVLRLDDMITFNPHQVLQNVTESVINSKNYGVATAAFVRELYSDKVLLILIILCSKCQIIVILRWK